MKPCTSNWLEFASFPFGETVLAFCIFNDVSCIKWAARLGTFSLHVFIETLVLALSNPTPDDVRILRKLLKLNFML